MPMKSTASLSVITTLKPKPRIVPPNDSLQTNSAAQNGIGQQSLNVERNTKLLS